MTRPFPGDMGMHRVTDVMPRVAMVAAGAAHTSCITDRGVVLAWRSADPQATTREVGGLLTGKQAVHISAGNLCVLTQSLSLDVNVFCAGGVGILTAHVCGALSMRNCSTRKSVYGFSAPPCWKTWALQKPRCRTLLAMSPFSDVSCNI